MPQDYAQAAERAHLDAETLYASQRLQTASHLHGLAAECALKAILAGLSIIPKTTVPPRNLKVHIDKLWDAYNLALSGPVATRWAITTPNPFTNWDVAQRYDDDGSVSPADATQHQSGSNIARRLLAAAKAWGLVV